VPDPVPAPIPNAARVGISQTLWRALGLVAHLVTGVLIIAWAGLSSRPGARPSWLPQAIRWWYQRQARVLGVHLEIVGTPAEGCLLVCNHISWLDVVALGAACAPDFLSKAEVRTWPVIGWMSAVQGTLFIHRGAREVVTVTTAIAARLAAGRTVVIFPEGTTGEGDGVGRFYPQLFAAAFRPGLAVQPIALSYRRVGGIPPERTVAFVGEQTMAESLWRILRHPGIIARVEFLAPLRSVPGDDRRALSSRARSTILAALGLPETAGRDIRARMRVAKSPG
jgi:lyso-ornithine lipid O-acyltransferase